MFIFGCVGSLLLHAGTRQPRQAGASPRHGTRAPHHGGLSHRRAQAPGMRASVAVAHRLSNCGLRALEHRPSSCGTRVQSSRFAARGILPDPGSNPRSLHWQADFQPPHHQGRPPACSLVK